jgi:PadR family transcriptional regulator PadR
MYSIALGEFEYTLIAAAAALGDGAYSVAIREEIASATRRRYSIGALSTTTDRLERKGFLNTWMGESTPERGGRAKRMVRVTAKGIQAAEEFYERVVRISRNVSWVEGREENA